MEKQRTLNQNSALHLALDELAHELYLQGRDMRKVIKVPVRPTKENVKELMFKPVMVALFPEVTSTAKLSTKQMTMLWGVFSEAMQDRFGIYVEWPSYDNQRINSYEKEKAQEARINQISE